MAERLYVNVINNDDDYDNLSHKEQKFYVYSDIQVICFLATVFDMKMEKTEMPKWQVYHSL